MEFITHFIASEFARSAVNALSKWRLNKYKIVKRSARIRISFAALLIICRNNRYALIRSLYRPDSFGPIGGVFKYAAHPRDLFHKLEFESQVGEDNQTTELDRDLRGFVSGKHLFALVSWFARADHRETAAECLSREMMEELREISAPFSPPALTSAHFTFVRRIQEGPTTVPNTNYLQFRIFEVYELNEHDEQVRKFVDEMIAFSKESKGIQFVTADEINVGRLKRGEVGKVIGHPAEYLLRGKRTRPDMPPIHT